MSREHITDGSQCWCNPAVEEHENGNVIIHNYDDNWQQYAKPGETAQQCIERHRSEQDALLGLLKQAAQHTALLRQALGVLESVYPYTDSLICYASTVDEHPPNAIDGNVRAAIIALRERLKEST